MLDFTALYEQNWRLVLRKCRNLTGNHADAEDLAQTAFVKAYRGLDTFAGEKPAAWLCAIVRNEFLNRLREMNRVRNTRSLDEHLDDAESITLADAVADPRALEAVEFVLLQLDLQRGLARLEERDRRLLTMRISGFDYAEIGAILGATASYLACQVCRARGKLREAMQL